MFEEEQLSGDVTKFESRSGLKGEKKVKSSLGPPTMHFSSRNTSL